MRRQLSFGASPLPVAAATVSLAEQDAVEPQASKGRRWIGTGYARTGTTHILPSSPLQVYANLCREAALPALAGRSLRYFALIRARLH
jgi:hypothetical protein